MKSKGFFRSFVPFLTVFLLLFSCTEKFIPNIDKDVSTIIVDGMITNESGPYQIHLYRTIPLNVTQDTLIPESGASIILYDDSGSSDFFVEISPGVYQNQTESFQGQVGTSYWIEIVTAKGDRFESIPEVMQPPLEIDNLYGEVVERIIDIDNNQKGVEFYFDAEDKTNTTNYLRWQFDESWEWHIFQEFIPKTEDPSKICYPTQHLNNINVFNASTLGDKRIKHLPASFIGDDEVRLRYAYVISLQLYSISKEAYDFWNNIKRIVQNNGNLYDITPTNAPGNIQVCEGNTPAWGYFEVSSISRKKGLFNEQSYDLEFPIGLKECDILVIRGYLPLDQPYHILWIEYDPFDGTPIYYVRRAYCYDCSVRYSKNKPSFWP